MVTTHCYTPLSTSVKPTTTKQFPFFWPTMRENLLSRQCSTITVNSPFCGLKSRTALVSEVMGTVGSISKIIPKRKERLGKILTVARSWKCIDLWTHRSAELWMVMREGKRVYVGAHTYTSVLLLLVVGRILKIHPVWVSSIMKSHSCDYIIIWHSWPSIRAISPVSLIYSHEPIKQKTFFSWWQKGKAEGEVRDIHIHEKDVKCCCQFEYGRGLWEQRVAPWLTVSTETGTSVLQLQGTQLCKRAWGFQLRMQLSWQRVRPWAEVPVTPCCTSDLQNCELINGYYFKSQSNGNLLGSNKN